MGKSTGRVRGLASLVVAGLVCTASIVYADATITVGNGSGQAGGMATFSATLSTGGAMVAGTSNDITFDTTNTPLATSSSGPGTCSVTTTKSCLKSSECPSGETCNLTVGPQCTTTLTNKNALFSFLKTAGCDNVTTMCACTPGTDCTAMRALIAGLDQPDNTAIPDGSTLYTCTVNIAAAATGGPFALTISNVQAADTSANPVTVTGVNGQISLGVPGSYTECDVNNNTGDDVGQFGDGAIDIFDVRALFNAAQGLATPPADGSARFSAMDSFTVDVVPACGGDQTLDIFDVRQCFNVAQGLASQNFVRTGTGASCMSAVAP